MFSRTYQEIKDVLTEGKPMLMACRVSVKNSEKSLILEKGQYVDEEKFGDNFNGVTFRIRSGTYRR